MTEARWPLEPEVEELRRWFDSALDLALEQVRQLEQAPAHRDDGVAALLEELNEPLPEEPHREPRELLRRLVEEYMPRSFHCAGPGYLAYVPGGGLPTGALADLIAGLCNRYVGVAAAAPVLVRLEIMVLRWFAALFGFPEETRGILTSGGSLANFTAIVCARHKLLGEDFLDGAIYCSDQVHHSVHKAASLAGFPARSIRPVGCNERRQLDPAGLRRAVAADRAAGLRPSVLVASAGTVNTGAIDDLGLLADIARDEGLWLHVDGAYGAFFQLTARGRKRLAGIERADSLTMDPHKGLFLPYGTGCLLVRRGEDLRAPHRSEASYLPAMRRDRLDYDFCEHSPELSRDFRGLRVWLSLKIFGRRAFAAALDEKLDLAHEAWSTLRACPYLEVLEEPPLSIVAFRVQPARDPDGRLTRQLLERVLARRRVFLSSTTLGGQFVLRLCILSFRTHRERLGECLEQLQEESRELCEVSA